MKSYAPERILPDLARVQPNRKIRLNQHPGQLKAWDSDSRFVAVIAGAQSGKTSWGPHWLLREIRACGPGDYLVATPTYSLLSKKALPEFKKVFQRWMQLGKYHVQEKTFKFSEKGCLKTFGYYDPDIPTNIIFGYAENPDSLESMTCKAAWLDEAGQKAFKLASWEAIQRRLSLSQGRALFTTTPYDLGWLKQQVYDRWKAGDPDYEVIRFDSTENPQFPIEEFERARRTLPQWKFDLFYRGIFTRPAGLIYDSYRDEPWPTGHLIPRQEIPPEWDRYGGLDFGGVNTASLSLAFDPDRRKYIVYREYHQGGRTAKQHAQWLTHGEPAYRHWCGGSGSEDQWRNEFKAAGLNVMEPPVSDVEVGIDRVYGMFANNDILVFDDIAGLRDELTTYSRELDDMGEPTEQIADKETFHLLDSLRYIGSYLNPIKAGQPATGGKQPATASYPVGGTPSPQAIPQPTPPNRPHIVISQNLPNPNRPPMTPAPTGRVSRG